MSDHLDQTLGAIESAYADDIQGGSRIYIEVDIGAQAQKLGYSDAARKYRKVFAVVPVKKAGLGMGVRIDGRTFVNYGQLPSGLIVPGHVVQQSKRPFKTYVPHDSMILNFT